MSNKKSRFPIEIEPKIPRIFLNVRAVVNKKEIEFEDVYISHLAMTSSAAGLLMPGDKVQRIENQIVTAKDIKSRTRSMLGKSCTFTISRRKNAAPATLERVTKAKVIPKNGYAYFVVTCTSIGKGSLGLGLQQDGNRLMVTQVHANSTAASFFANGDALLDMNEEPNYQSASALMDCSKYQTELFKNGGFTTLIERPVRAAEVKAYQKKIETTMATPNPSPIGADAIAIGREAAAFHNNLLRRITPRSCMTADREAEACTRASTTVVSTEEKERKVTMTSESIETKVASDVEDDEDLKPVERKSHAVDGPDNM